MDNHTPAQVLCPHQLEETLKRRFDYMWVMSDEIPMWEMRFLIKAVELDHRRFKINISAIACRQSNANDMQHAAYLELLGDNGRLSLHWSNGVNHTLERAIKAFSTIYPLERIVAEVRDVLAPHPVDVQMPQIEHPELAALSA